MLCLLSLCLRKSAPVCQRQKEDSEDIPRPTEGSEEDESSEHVVLDVQARAAPAGGAPRGRMAPSKKATWASTLPKEWVTELEKYDSGKLTPKPLSLACF